MRALASFRAASKWSHLFRRHRLQNLLKFSNNKSKFYSLLSFLQHPHKFWCPACALFPQSSALAASTQRPCVEGLWCSRRASSKPGTRAGTPGGSEHESCRTKSSKVHPSRVPLQLIDDAV